MSLFKDILSTIEKKFLLKEQEKEIVVSVIKNTTGITIHTNQITIKDNKVWLQTNPTVRLAVSIQKEKIIELCAQEGVTVFSIT